jgi:outer membrane protein assembly factor BamA
MTFRNYLIITIFTSIFIFRSLDATSKEKIVVSAINISGNTITNARIIHRELTFKLGDSILISEIPNLIRQSKENLDNTLLFNFVTFDHSILDDTFTCDINLEERWYIWPFPIFEYEDRNLSAFIRNGDFSRINYGAYIRVDNFRGMREQIRLRMILGYRKQISLQYFTQNLDREKKHGLSAWISYFTNHEVHYGSVDNKPVYYVSQQGPARQVFFTDLSYQYRPQHHWYHTLTIGALHSRITDSLAILNPNYFGKGNQNFWYSQIKYEAMLDKRNSKIFPLSGYMFRSEIGRQGFFKNESLSRWYLKLTGGIYPKLANRIYSGVDLMVKGSTQTNLPHFMNEAIGFKDFIRGYEYYVTNGSNFIINKNSLKLEVLPPKVINLPLIPEGKFKKAHLAIYWSLFADTGYVKPDSFTPANSLEGNLIVGYGSGLYIVAYYDVVLRLEYSFNKFGERGIFIHFGTPFLTN